MGNSTHNFSVLQNRAAAHPLHNTPGDFQQPLIGYLDTQIAMLREVIIDLCNLNGKGFRRVAVYCADDLGFAQLDFILQGDWIGYAGKLRGGGAKQACVIILMHRRENLIFQITQQFAGAALLPCFNAGDIGGDQRSAVHRHGQAGIHIRNRMSQPCNKSGFRVIISEGAEPGRAVAYPKADGIALFGCRRRNPDRL